MQTKNIVAGKKYTTKSGEEKTRWITVGKLFIKDDGHFSVKFEEYINPSAFKNEKGEVWFNVFDDDKTSDKPADKDVSESKPNAYADFYKKVAAQQMAANYQQSPDEKWFTENQEIINAMSN